MSNYLKSLTPASTTANAQHFQSMLKSPTAPLPTFASSEGENLIKFFKQFEETINRFHYSDYDKLILLKQQVKGRAATLLNSLEVDNQPYDVAKNLLIDALASPALQKFQTLKLLSELKLDFNTDPFDYIAQIRTIQESFKNLTISNADVLQYFTWSGLNESFKSQIVQITNETRPSFEKIKEKFFEASERYQTDQKSSKSKPKGKENSKEQNSKEPNQTGSVGLAAQVKYDVSQNVFKSCTSCTQSKIPSHPLHKCAKYLDAKAKVKRLEELNGCTKCGKLNHSEKSCKFNFNRKCRCGLWHFDFLCTSPASNSTRKKLKGSETQTKSVKCKTNPPEPNKQGDCKKETASGLIYVEETLKADDSSNIILPTFSCTLSNKHDLHCLRDTGCQSNFISEAKAQKENLEVVNASIKLKVNGFNTSKVYLTKSVKVSFTIGDQNYEVEALCIPNIHMILKLPGLEAIVREFIRKGYQLADKCFNDDVIRDIDFILGSVSAYCLKESHISFGSAGKNEPSVYSNTAAGVMLMGNVKMMLLNLDYLPHSPINIEATAATSQNVITCESLGFHSTTFIESFDECLEQPDESKILVVGNENKIKYSEIEKAADQILDNCCYDTLNYDKEHIPENSV